MKRAELAFSFFWVAAGTLVACSGGVTLQSSAAASGAGGTTTVASSWSTDFVSSGDVNPVTSTGAGGAGPCYPSGESLTVGIESPEGPIGCQPGMTTNYSVTGTLSMVGSNRIDIDACPPWADCAPMITHVKLDAPGLDVIAVSGAFVTMNASFDQPMGCIARIEIMNLPSWGGVMNPILVDPVLFFEGSDGSLDTFPDSPVTLSTSPLGCAPEVYALIASAQGSSIYVNQGSSGYLSPTSPSQALEVHDLRSYDPSPDELSYGYWIVQVMTDAH